MRTVTLIPGDGTGPELTSAMRRVLDAAGAKLQWEVAEAGEEAAAKHGTPLPASTLESVRRHPHFKEVMVEMKLVDYWRESGRWPTRCRPLGEHDFECF